MKGVRFEFHCLTHFRTGEEARFIVTNEFPGRTLALLAETYDEAVARTRKICDAWAASLVGVRIEYQRVIEVPE